MSGQQYLNTITENATRFGMRLQESFSERTRDLALTRGASAAYLDNLDDRAKNIRKQLDSNSDREKLDAMKRLIAVCNLFYLLRQEYLTSCPADFQGAQRFRVLCPGCKERRFAES